MIQIRPVQAGTRVAAIASLALVSACALLPLVPDSDARAPTLTGFGNVAMPITTRSTTARQWFDQGMAQTYAFNEVEAVRAFKAALAQDPDCAMCAWGVAYQLGPNINNTDRDNVPQALRYADYALRHADHVSPRERGLIEALAVRYGHRSEAKYTASVTAILTADMCGANASGDERADPLDIVYADRMRQLADRFPDDPDILSIYAEAEMIATRADWWDDTTGKPVGRMGEVAQRLEDGLKQHLNHIGLNHYLIHAVDALPVAKRAEASADRLGRLAPKSPHLLHMPAHTFVHLGRYADATRVNQEGMAADQAFRDTLSAQEFTISRDWRGHNSQFLWYAALMEGRADLALETARASALRATKADSAFGEFVRSRPLLTLLRFERWDAILQEPLPSGSKGMATVLGQFVRGVALARSGQRDAASAALTTLEPAARSLIQAHATSSGLDKRVRGLAEVAQERLRAEVALAQGRFDVALAHQAHAMLVGKEIDQSEPPMLGAGNRIALGDMQLQAKRWADAELSFRTDLAEHPGSGWALRGLTRALQAQGRMAEVAPVQVALAQAWRVADAGLLPAVR